MFFSLSLESSKLMVSVCALVSKVQNIQNKMEDSVVIEWRVTLKV